MWAKYFTKGTAQDRLYSIRDFVYLVAKLRKQSYIVKSYMAFLFLRIVPERQDKTETI